MSRKKGEKKEASKAKVVGKGITPFVTKPDTSPKARLYKHKFVNCALTINPEEVAMGKSSIRIMLQKNKQDEWGSFSTDDEQKQKLISGHPLFGKQIFEISAEEYQKISKREKPEQYHRGVVGALMGKGKR